MMETIFGLNLSSVLLKIGEAELLEILYRPIKTTLKFKEDSGLEKDLLAELKYNPEQKEFVEYLQIPNNVPVEYSREREFILNKQILMDVIENGRSVGNFNGLNKFYIKIVD